MSYEPTTDRFAKVLINSTVGHVLLIVGVALTPLISRLLWRPKPKEIITFIDLQVAIPKQNIAPVNAEQPKTPDLDQPKPTPPEQKSEMTDPNSSKPKIERSTKRVKRATAIAAPAPKTKPLSAEQIKKLLDMGARISDQTVVPDNPDDLAMASYYALVRQALYALWQQPNGLSAGSGLTVDTEIHVLRDGTVTSTHITHPSGNQLMDASVESALQSIKKLKPLPAQFPGSSKDIIVVFELGGMGNVF